MLAPMSSRLTQRTGCFWDRPEAGLPLRSLILYDEPDSGRRAVQTLHSVTRKLDEAVEMDVCLWRLDMLEDPALHDAAKRDAEDASMLVVSVRQAHRVPRSDHGVLATFFRQARWSNAMVVGLVNDPRIHPVALSHSLAGLREETRRAGLEFLGCSTGATTDQEDAGPARQPAPGSRGSHGHGCGYPLNFRTHLFPGKTPGRQFQARVQTTSNPNHEFP